VLLIAKSEPARYRVVLQQSGADETVYQGAYLLPLKGLDYGYVASLPSEGTARLLFIVQVNEKTLEVRYPEGERIKEVAAKVGAIAGDRGTLKGGTREVDAFRMLRQLADGAPSDAISTYRRVGWFTDADRKGATYESAEGLERVGRKQEATQLYMHLAFRGEARSQMRIGEIVAREKRPLDAAFWFLSAHRSGHPRAAERLADHLQAHSVSDPDGATMFRTPLHWLMMARQQSTPDHEVALARKMVQAARRECEKSSAAGNLRIPIDECIERSIEVETMASDVKRTREGLQSGIQELEAERERLVKERDRNRAEQAATQDEIGKLRERILGDLAVTEEEIAKTETKIRKLEGERQSNPSSRGR